MKKNYFFSKLILAGVFTLTTATAFVGCKDYDDDISNLQTQITANADAIKKLQDLVSAGKFVTDVTGTADGIKVTMNDGTSTEIKSLNGKDGKDGTVWTISDDGFWVKDNVPTTIKAVGKDGAPGKAGDAGKDGHEVKISEDGYWMVWDAEAGDYAKTDYIAGGASAAEVAGGWNIFIKDDAGVTQTIFVPTSLALASLDLLGFQDNDPKDMKVYYGIVRANKNYGIGNQKTMKAGIYSRLDRDLKVLVNPVEVDATLYDFEFQNSVNHPAVVDFYPAEPFKGILNVATRAASDNGIWVLPAKVNYNEKIEETRVNLYQSFKGNDDKAYLLALTGTFTGHNATVKSKYESNITLKKAEDVTSPSINVINLDYREVGVDYTPVYQFGPAASDSALVYDYWLEIEPSASNIRLANDYKVTVSADGYSFSAAKPTVVNNNIEFIFHYILIDGRTGSDNFIASFKEGTGVNNEITLDRYNVPFDAEQIGTTPIFGLDKSWSLNTMVAAMSDADKLLWNDAVTSSSWSAVLYGGDPDNNATDLNWKLKNNIAFSITPTSASATSQLAVKFKASSDPAFLSGLTVDKANFTLNCAYELVITVTDPVTGSTLGTIHLPFEFKQPTLDITRTSNERAIWNGNVLSIYGDLAGTKMYAPMYEAFKSAYKTPYTVFKYQTRYYDVTPTLPGTPASSAVVFGSNGTPVTLAAINYSTLNTDWNSNVDAVEVANLYNGTAGPVASVPVVSSYKFYGVYDANVGNFTVKFASLIGDSKSKKAAQSEFIVNNTERYIILDDSNFDMKSALDKKYYLFDGVTAETTTGTIIPRASLARQSFTEAVQGFQTVVGTGGTITATVVRSGVRTPLTVTAMGNATLNVAVDGTREYVPVAPSANDLQIYTIPAGAGVPAGVAPSVGEKANPGAVMIQLPTSIGTNEPVTITIHLTDVFGVEVDLDPFTLVRR